MPYTRLDNNSRGDTHGFPIPIRLDSKKSGQPRAMYKLKSADLLSKFHTIIAPHPRGERAPHNQSCS
jgi:hypothetical protein